MKKQEQYIRDEKLFKFASTKRYLKIFLPDFAFRHDDKSGGKDRFIGREVLIRKLYTWLTSDSKSGSYLVTGYRGMGKSLLVKRVVGMVCREPEAKKELLFKIAMTLVVVSCFLGFVLSEDWPISVIPFILALAIVLYLKISKYEDSFRFERAVKKFPFHKIFGKDLIAKFWIKKHLRHRKYSNIAITINLGQEILQERDVLSLITQNIRDKYSKFIHGRQNRPIVSFAGIFVSCLIAFLLTRFVIIPAWDIFSYDLYQNLKYDSLKPDSSWFSSLICSVLFLLQEVFNTSKFSNVIILFLIYILFYICFVKLIKFIRKKVPLFSVPFNSIDRLNALCERISSSINEEQGTNQQYSSRIFNFSLKNGKSKTTPKATVRELEQELMSIINDINSDNCPKDYRAQFIIVFDELDKISKAPAETVLHGEKDSSLEYDPSVKGFTDAMATEERKHTVLKLLANMKLFITSVNAKCVFISGHELFDASLADLSDREFAISSIFNGVLNVSSFLSPEREQTDVSSMTEVYLATMLLPEKFLKEKIKENAQDNYVLKDEMPSLRWYNEYLMRIHVLESEFVLSDEEMREKEKEIRHVMEFLRYFCVYLSHVSNGSPKKIATYFEKYVKINYETITQFDWYDEIAVGKPTEKDVRKQCVLFFDTTSQKLIGFIHYIASPIINAITNEVSNYGDKLLVSSSFMLDQIYKYHGKGFSWRNLEQMPELLNTNKNPELRDSMASIMEFLLQTHLAVIPSGIFQYKFHRQIAEEISMLSKISEEAAAIFNFTLNESETVKRYNTRLLQNYLNLKKLNDKESDRYDNVIERIHENLGDIYFSEEDYYRSIYEYRSALQYITRKGVSSSNILPYIVCSLKIGMSYEYRHTFENAYIMYSQIINELLTKRWIEEQRLGLVPTMKISDDWQIKQTIFVDLKALSWRNRSIDPEFQKQFNMGLWNNLCKEYRTGFGFDADKTISEFSKFLSPEKNEILQNLEIFEDVKYIYQAIIAKLFVVEKMESGGITRTNIDVAEAEFITLYSFVNHHEKFILAADFFSKMAGVLYYKNNSITSAPVGILSAALYGFDIDLVSLIDDYCLITCEKDHDKDAVEIKDNINECLNKVKTQTAIDKLKDKVPSKLKDIYRREVLKDSGLKKEEYKDFDNYLTFLEDIKFDDRPFFNLKYAWKRLKECETRRSKMNESGHKLPCHACKYVNRSLKILMLHMFNDNEGVESRCENESKVFTLIKKTSRKHIRFLKPELLSQLAYSTEQLADIMVSCACTKNVYVKQDDIVDYISTKTFELLSELTGELLDEKSRKYTIEKKYEIYFENESALGRLDKALLYYWAACRYYEMASRYHESAHCMLRIAKVIENYLTIISSNNANVIYKTDTIENVLGNLFKRLSRLIGRQYDNHGMAEINDYQWLYHLDFNEYIDLSKLKQFSDMLPLFLSVEKSKLMIYKKKDFDKFVKHIIKIYKNLNPAFKHELTFRAEVELDWFRVQLNKEILSCLLSGFHTFDELFKRYYLYKKELEPESIPAHIRHSFLDAFIKFLKKGEEKTNFEKELFEIDKSVNSRIELVEYLIFDSLLCLSNIIKDFPPHNQATTFSNSFMAQVYEEIWVLSECYFDLSAMLKYYGFLLDGDEKAAERYFIMSGYDIFPDGYKDRINTYASFLKEKGVSIKDSFGYRNSKLFIKLRHEMDDSTINHIFNHYSLEMAIKYYGAARAINGEGEEYKNLINNMYVLDDDLHNDTCQSNLADERYFLNSDVIDPRRELLHRIREHAKTNKIDSYEKSPLDDDKQSDFYNVLTDRFKDSLFINTEY